MNLVDSQPFWVVHHSGEVCPQVKHLPNARMSHGQDVFQLQSLFCLELWHLDGDGRPRDGWRIDQQIDLGLKGGQGRRYGWKWKKTIVNFWN